MATIPNSTLFYPPVPSTQICYKPIRSALPLSSSKSRSFAIKCSNNDTQKKVVNLVNKFSGFVEEVLNVNDMQKFMSDVEDIVSKSDDDFVSDIVDEVLNKDDREVKDLGRGSARARKRIEWAKSQYLQQELEIKNLKAHVNRLQNRASEDVQDIVLKSDDEFVSDIVKEVLNKDDREVKDLGRGSARARKKIEWAKSQYLQQEIEIKNLKAYVNRLQNRASEVELCQKKLSKARELVEESEHSLKLVMKTLQHQENVPTTYGV